MALTRFNATTPVRYDAMNKLCDEVEVADSQLLNKINVLKEHGFWSNAKLATGSVYDLQHGEWFGTLTNSPESYTCFYKVFVGDNSNFKYIECHSWVTSNSYKNKCVGGVWQGWQQIATTVKTSFNITPKPSITVFSQSNYIQNDKMYINIRMVGTFVGGTNYLLGTLPQAVEHTALSIVGNGGGWIVSGSAWVSSTDFICTLSANCTEIRVSGVVSL